LDRRMLRILFWFVWGQSFSQRFKRQFKDFDIVERVKLKNIFGVSLLLETGFYVQELLFDGESGHLKWQAADETGLGGGFVGEWVWPKN
jgi:hypothetical protein